MNLPNESKNIRAVMILEIIGRPPEHLTEALEKIIQELDKEKGVKVLNKKINKPVGMEEQKEFYTTFAEIEVETEEIIILAMLMFKYMPAHIEIITPELIAVPNTSWNEILNELTRRLHGYDEVARILQNERMIMQQKLQELMQENAAKTPEKKLSKKTPKKSVKKKSKK